jgi:mono/diheme cytochrome c family protein
MRQVLRKQAATACGRGAAALLAGVVFASCAPTNDQGFDKVGVRSHEPIAMAPMPDPPPVRGDLAGAAGAGPVVLAQLPAGVTQEMVDEGQQLYGTVCVACHGAAGMGGPVGPALNDQNWIHITGEFEEIVAITTSGVAQPRQYPAPMPARGGGPFTDEQIRAISAYVYALSHAGGS